MPNMTLAQRMGVQPQIQTPVAQAGGGYGYQAPAASAARTAPGVTMRTFTDTFQQPQMAAAPAPMAAQQPAAPVYGAPVTPLGVVEPFNNYQKEALTAAMAPTARPQNTAGLSAALQQAISGASSYVTGLESSVPDMTPFWQRAQRSISDPGFAGTLQAYLNPYTQQVVDRSNSAIDRSYEAQRSDAMGRNPGSRSFGTTAQGTQLAQLGEAQARTIGDNTAQLNYAGYNDAISRFIDENKTAGTMAMQGTELKDRFNLAKGGLYGGLVGNAISGQASDIQTTGALNDMALADIQRKLTAGGIIQGQNQRLVDVVAAEQNAARDYPVTNLTQLQNWLAAFNDGSSVGATQYRPSTLQTVGGLGMALGAMLPSFGSGGGSLYGSQGNDTLR